MGKEKSKRRVRVRLFDSRERPPADGQILIYFVYLLTLLLWLQECFVVLVREERADCALDERTLATTPTSNYGDIYQL